MTPWRPGWFAFILAFLYPLWVNSAFIFRVGRTNQLISLIPDAFDTGIYISEEVDNAGWAVPLTIAIPAYVNGILGFGERSLCEHLMLVAMY